MCDFAVSETHFENTTLSNQKQNKNMDLMDIISNGRASCLWYLTKDLFFFEHFKSQLRYVTMVLNPQGSKSVKPSHVPTHANENFSRAGPNKLAANSSLGNNSHPEDGSLPRKIEALSITLEKQHKGQKCAE
jgi:hypothetical protein